VRSIFNALRFAKLADSSLKQLWRERVATNTRELDARIQ
jgi:hypothetical protein